MKQLSLAVDTALYQHLHSSQLVKNSQYQPFNSVSVSMEVALLVIDVQ